MKKTFVLLALSFSFLAFGQTTMRVVDTFADLELLYPNIEQPSALVSGRLVRGDFSPPRVYFWNPDSLGDTNDSVRPVRMGIGRWIYSTNLVVDGRVTLGHSNQFGATVTIDGFLFGTSGLVLRRSGSATNGMSIGPGQIGFREEGPGVSRFISVVANTDTTASLYLGGNAYPGFTSGRAGVIFAPSVDLTTTNHNKPGGPLDLYAGGGSGTAPPPRIGFRLPQINTNSPTAGQTNITTAFALQFPEFPSSTNNTVIRTVYNKEPISTNPPIWQPIRVVVTNEAGILRFIGIEE